MEQRLELPPPLGPEEGMELVDDDETECAEQAEDAGPLENENRFQRFGSDEKDSSRVVQQRVLARYYASGGYDR